MYLGVYIPATNIHPQICNAINMPKATRSSSIYTSPNIPHYILHNVKYAEMRALYWKKKKSNKFNTLQIEVFFLPNIDPTV